MINRLDVRQERMTLALMHIEHLGSGRAPPEILQRVADPLAGPDSHGASIPS